MSIKDKPGAHPFPSVSVSGCLCCIVSACPPGIHNSCTAGWQRAVQRDAQPPFLSPSPRFCTAPVEGSHCAHQICSGQSDDHQIETNQKFFLTYPFLSPSFFWTCNLKKTKSLLIWSQAVEPARQLKTNPNPIGLQGIEFFDQFHRIFWLQYLIPLTIFYPALIMKISVSSTRIFWTKKNRSGRGPQGKSP